MDTLSGIPVVSSRHMVDRVPYRLPRTKVKTRSIRKAYNRLRRKHGGFRTVPSGTAYMVGGTIVAHPDLVEKITRAVQVSMETRWGEVVAEAIPAGGATTGGITQSSLMDSLRTLPRMANANNDIFLTRSFEVPELKLNKFYTRHEPAYAIPARSPLLISCSV